MFYGHRFIRINTEYLFDLTEGIGYRTEVSAGKVTSYESAFKIRGIDSEPDYMISNNGIVPIKAREAAETSKRIMNNYQKLSLLA